jgi:hypothetical protein
MTVGKYLSVGAKCVHDFPDLTLDALTEELAAQCTEVSKGNLSGPRQC